MKVGITNTVLSNAGDAAICLSIKTMLERDLAGPDSEVEVVVFDSDVDVTSGYFREWRVFQQLVQARPGSTRAGFIVRQLCRTSGVWLLSACPGVLRLVASSVVFRGTLVGRSLSELASCDVIVSNGGTYLVDHYDFTHRFVELRSAKALGKPVVLWTQSMGPFRTRRARWLARRIAADVDGVFCRDARSAEHWREVTGYAGPVAVAPDAAFSLEPPGTPSSPGLERPARAAVSVREWSRQVGGEPLDRLPYESMMRESITTLDRLGLRPLAVSTCQGLPTYGYDDSAIAEQIFEGLDVEIDRQFHTPSELLDVLSGCQLVVTTRMHLAILAIVARIPVVAIAYEFKTLELFESIGLAHAVVRIEDASPEWMSYRIRQALDEPDRYLLSTDQLADLRHRAAAPVELVRVLAAATTAPSR